MHNHKPYENDTCIYYHQICAFVYKSRGEDTDPLKDLKELY